MFNYKWSESIGGLVNIYMLWLIVTNGRQRKATNAQIWGKEITRIMVAIYNHITSSSGLRKFQATWFLLNKGYIQTEWPGLELIMGTSHSETFRTKILSHLFIFALLSFGTFYMVLATPKHFYWHAMSVALTHCLPALLPPNFLFLDYLEEWGSNFIWNIISKYQWTYWTC
jgi:hypothetical protein